MITRTRYKLVADPAQADATLYGSIANMFSNATTYDAVTGAAPARRSSCRFRFAWWPKTARFCSRGPISSFAIAMKSA